MGLVSIPSVLDLMKSSNETSDLVDTNGRTLRDDLVISSKKLEGMATNMLLALKNNLFHSFSNDLTGGYQMEQWVPMSGTLNFSDMCKAGKLSVNFNGSYAACIIPKHSRRSQRSAMLTRYCEAGKEGVLCVQDLRGVLELLCIGDFDRDGESSASLVSQNTQLFKTTTLYRDAAKYDNGNKLGLTFLSDLDSPVSVLDPFFEDPSPTIPADAIIKSEKLPLRSVRVSFEERSPVKKLHSNTISKTKTSIPISSKKHISSALDYTRKVLEVSDLNRYQLALNWQNTTQMLDQATFNKMKSHSTSQMLKPLETRLLFDHINEVLFDTYHPCHGPQPHHEDIVLKIVEMNLVLKQDQVTEQELVIDYMEKCGRTWMDTRRDLEDMVMEIAEEVADEVVEEFMFETWID